MSFGLIQYYCFIAGVPLLAVGRLSLLHSECRLSGKLTLKSTKPETENEPKLTLADQRNVM